MTNLSFSGWVQLFGYPKITTALLDLSTHPCVILETGDNSYPLKHWKKIVPPQ